MFAGTLEDERVVERLLASVRKMPAEQRVLPVLALLHAISAASTEAGMQALLRLVEAALLVTFGSEAGS